MRNTVLLLPHKDYFYSQYKKYVETYYIFKDIKCKFILGIKRLHFILFPYFYKIWFTVSFNNAHFERYDKIIVFDSYYSPYLVNFLKRKYKDKDVILYYRNHIDDPSALKKVKSDISIWSYDPQDCEKYGLKFNTQFYFTSIFANNNIIETQQNYDFFFIGQIKGRKTIINEVNTILQKMGYKVLFYVIDETKKDSPSNRYIDYTEVIELMSRSRCIVDLVGAWQKGLTLRPLEALFAQKKLLTNFKEIKDYDFYSSRNIFVYGVDKISSLNEFLDAPMDTSVIKYIAKYNFPNWLERF